jgi:hypothetical protein
MKRFALLVVLAAGLAPATSDRALATPTQLEWNAPAGESSGDDDSPGNDSAPLRTPAQPPSASLARLGREAEKEATTNRADVRGLRQPVQAVHRMRVSFGLEHTK